MLENTEETLISDIKYLEWNWRAQWQKHGRTKNRFELHEKDWLDGSAFKMEKFIQTSSVNSNKRGRPTKNFSETSDRTRRRIANDSVYQKKKSME